LTGAAYRRIDGRQGSLRKQVEVWQGHLRQGTRARRYSPDDRESGSLVILMVRWGRHSSQVGKRYEDTQLVCVSAYCRLHEGRICRTDLPPSESIWCGRTEGLNRWNDG